MLSLKEEGNVWFIVRNVALKIQMKQINASIVLVS